MLLLENLDVRNGAIRALCGIDVTVRQGEIVALLGANGAGKSTVIKTISGLVTPTAGRIVYHGEDIAGLAAHVLVGRGICHTPEGRRVFANLSVRENLEMGAYARDISRHEVREEIERVLRVFPRLQERVDQLGGTLSGGEQQMLAIGRALMARPKLLLLDEPSLGLAPFLVRQILGIIRDINEQGVTILLVEQNANQALKIAHRAYVLESGQVAMHGSSADLLADEGVRGAYLGH